MLRHPPANNQRTVALFVALGHHDSLMRRLSHAFRERWQAMRGALARHLPHCKAWSSIGGTAYWIEGPPQLDARETERRAALAGILIEPGDIHFLRPTPPRHAFRLGFSSIPVDRIEPGPAEARRHHQHAADGGRRRPWTTSARRDLIPRRIARGKNRGKHDPSRHQSDRLDQR